MADGDGTIEGALEVTRNLHRAIISVSAITFVFALSLRQPESEKSQQKSVQHFLNFDFSEYDRFVDAKVAAVAAQWLTQPSDELRADLEKSKAPVFGTSEIVSAFEKPTLVGRFKVNETKLSTPGNMTVRELDLLKALPIAEDVRILVPTMAEAGHSILEFLENNGKAGMKVQTVRVANAEDYPDSDLPKAGTSAKMTIYFELFGQTPPFPVFQAGVNAVVRVVPGTSFSAWLARQTSATEFTGQTRDGLSWFPALKALPKDQAERRLADVLATLKGELEKGRPESHKVSLLGAEIPGSLLIFATPLTLLALLYYLLFHLVHLSRYATEHAVVVRRFAWLPLTLDAGWAWETLISIALLPLAALLTLGVQLLRSEFLTMGSGAFIAFVTLGAGWLAIKSVRELSAIRRRIAPAAEATPKEKATREPSGVHPAEAQATPPADTSHRRPTEKDARGLPHC
jgi:hypothetical protein